MVRLVSMYTSRLDFKFLSFIVHLISIFHIPYLLLFCNNACEEISRFSEALSHFKISHFFINLNRLIYFGLLFFFGINKCRKNRFFRNKWRKIFILNKLYGVRCASYSQCSYVSYILEFGGIEENGYLNKRQTIFILSGSVTCVRSTNEINKLFFAPLIPKRIFELFNISSLTSNF